MNEEQLIEFINWLPTAVPEFQNASPEQIVQTLNQLYESEEGQATLSQLFTAFQESKNEPQSQMFKKGGKMAAFVNKYGNGGCVSCKKKEILRGGMVNKIAEKMQDGGKNPSTSKNTDSNTTYSRKDMYNITPAGEGLMDVATILRRISNDQHEAIDRIISGNDVYGIGDTLYRRRLLNGPYLVPERSKSQYYLTPRDAAWQNGGYGTRKFEGLGTAPREWETLFKSFETPQMKNGGELATMTSAETANNIGLIPKAQGGNDTTDWHTNSILEVLPQMRFARRRTYGPGFVDEMSAYSDSLDNATLGRLIMPNPTSGQQDTTYFRFFNNPIAEPVYMPLTGNTKKQVDAKFDNTLKRSKNK